MTDDIDVDELVAQHKEETSDGRHATEAAVEQASDNGNDEDSASLEDHVRDAYHQLDAGDLPKNLTIRDENLAALFYGLKQSGELKTVGEMAADTIGRDPEGLDTKAGVLRNLVRVALQDVDPDVIESAKEGKRRFEADLRDDF